jgi:DNA replication and repair protein RecF
VIEAVQIVTSGRSFRRPKWDEVIKWDEDAATIQASITTTTESRVEVGIRRGSQRTFRLNGLTKRRVSDIVGILPVVVFTPDDLDLSKGSAEVRRTEVDDLGEQLSKTYGAVRRDYNKVVRHRNVLLREWQATDADLEPWDVQLASLGSRLLVHRRRLLRKITEHARESYQELSQDEQLTVQYLDRCGLSTSCLEDEIEVEVAEKTIFSTLENRRDEERARKTTLVGPHRDEIVFQLDNRDARAFASQGQQRTIALAWKLAEVDVVEDVAHKKPVLLLDDVMSELDENRRRALTGLVQRNIQTFVTTTDAAHFDPDLLAEALVINAGDL